MTLTFHAQGLAILEPERAQLIKARLMPMSFCFSTIDRLLGLGLRTGRVGSQRRFAVGPEV